MFRLRSSRRTNGLTISVSRLDLYTACYKNRYELILLRCFLKHCILHTTILIFFDLYLVMFFYLFIFFF